MSKKLSTQETSIKEKSTTEQQGRILKTRQNTSSIFSNWMVLLCLSGLFINLLLSKIVIFLGLPLYIDNVGSILVGALGGPLPGIMIGFLSNVLNSLDNPISLYYGILTILMAWLASNFSQKGMFKQWQGWLAASMCFVLIGGAVGSIMTWLLYGGEISGIGAPLANYFYAHGMTPFLSQLTADILVDIPDKMITVGIVCTFLHFYPKALYGKFPYSSLYERHNYLKNSEETENAGEVWSAEDEKRYGHSVNKRLTSIVVASVAAVGIFSLVIGVFYYQQLLSNNSRFSSQYVSSRAAVCVDGNTVEDQMQQGEASAVYRETKKKLNEIYAQSVDIRYLYVYVVKPEGCYVLYDVDVPGEKGKSAGAFVENDPDIYNRLDEFLAGGTVEPGYGNSPYGTLVSAYTPVYDSSGKTVAYACADINLSTYVQKMLVYAIQFASLVFAIILITLLFMIWYVNHHITEPIQSIVNQTKVLDPIRPENWLDSRAWLERIPVRTDDELEELYRTVTKTEENISLNVKRRMETEQKLLQTEELERVNKELEEMIRKADEANQAKTDFLARMSHDMRTPMNAIIGLSALTLDEAKNPAAVRENMTKMRSSSDFLLGLVNDILDMAKIEDGSVVLNPEPYTFHEFISNMRTMFQPQCEAKGIRLTLQQLKQNPLVLVDKMRTNQIFFNILSNAVKYTPAGGRINYRIENPHMQGNRICIDNVIEDNGIGMSEEYQKHLFEPFMQENNDVTPELQGSGLGLSITKQLVDLMGGTIRVESEKGKGTKVTVCLSFECLSENAKDHQEKEVFLEAADQSLAGKRVLLVEDHPLNAQIAIRLLEKKKVTVTHAENGRIAVEMFQASEVGSFDAVLMDIRMPEMFGLDATRAIRKLNRGDAQKVPIIAMSANAYAEDVQKSLDAGMNGHLAKPVDPEMLYQTLARV